MLLQAQTQAKFKEEPDPTNSAVCCHVEELARVRRLNVTYRHTRHFAHDHREPPINGGVDSGDDVGAVASYMQAPTRPVMIRLFRP